MDAVIIQGESTQAGRVPPGLSGCPGVNLRAGGRLDIDGRYRPDEAALLRLRANGEPLRVPFLAAGEPIEATDSDLRIINDRHSSVELSRDDVVVFRDFAVNDRLAKKPVKFTHAALERFGNLFTEGRTVLLHHDDAHPVGTTFGAELVEREVRGVEATWLAVKWYGVTADASPERLQDLRDAQTGVLRHSSIRPLNGEWTFKEMEAPDGESTISFFLIDDNPDAPPSERLDVVELSRVHLGAVDGAGSDNFSGEGRGEGAPHRPDNAEISTTGHQSTASQPDLILCDC